MSLQYHFNSKGKVSPFLGAGLNYTTFFSEDTQGALEGVAVRVHEPREQGPPREPLGPGILAGLDGVHSC